MLVEKSIYNETIQKVKVGPNLKNLDEKVSREWIAKWIQDPKKFRHNTKMPSTFGQDNQSSPEMQAWNDAEIYAMSSYLASDNGGKKSTSDYRFMGDSENGQHLFESIGCLGCHVIEPEPLVTETTLKELTKRQGPNLIGIGSKTSAEWVYNWIKDPLAYNPESRMPNLRVNDKDAKDITAYIMSFRNEDFENLPNVNLDLSSI